MRLFGLVGWSGSGKTTLMVRLVEILTSRGLSVSTVKHAHADFDIDRPGKDSHRHRHAGATEVLLGSAGRWALIHELRGRREPTLPELLRKLTPVDWVLAEGFKAAHHPKLEVRRATPGGPLLADRDPNIVAIATDAPLAHAPRPVLDLNDAEKIAAFLLKHGGAAL